MTTPIFSLAMTQLQTPDLETPRSTGPTITLDMIAHAFQPLLQRTVGDHPLHANNAAWLLLSTAFGPAAARRWVLDGKVVLDIFPLDDLLNRGYAKKAEPWYALGWERQILITAVKELDSVLQPLVNRAYVAWRHETIAERVRATWGDHSTLVELAVALSGIRPVDWSHFHRQGHHGPADPALIDAIERITYAENCYMAAKSAVGEFLADDCWNANSPNRYNR